MLEKTTTDFRIIFLQSFTRELLRSSKSYIEIKVKHEAKKPLNQDLQSYKADEQKTILRDFVKSKIKQEKESVENLKSQPEEMLFKSIMSQPEKQHQRIAEQVKEKLTLPHFKAPVGFKPVTHEAPLLPSTVRDIMPMASHETIDLGKINPLIKDPFVKTIELTLSNMPLEVTGKMGRKKTQIALTENEAIALMERFALAAKLPFEPGFFKAAYGNLLVSAIIPDPESESNFGTRFVITKMHSQF